MLGLPRRIMSAKKLPPREVVVLEEILDALMATHVETLASMRRMEQTLQEISARIRDQERCR